MNTLLFIGTVASVIAAITGVVSMLELLNHKARMNVRCVNLGDYIAISAEILNGDKSISLTKIEAVGYKIANRRGSVSSYQLHLAEPPDDSELSDSIPLDLYLKPHEVSDNLIFVVKPNSSRKVQIKVTTSSIFFPIKRTIKINAMKQIE